MLGTTASKFIGSAFVVLASTSGIASIDKSTLRAPQPHDLPVVLDSKSLLVATLTNGQIETQWLTRETCERIASAVAAGEKVVGSGPDGSKMTIAEANCSTRRVEASPETTDFHSADAGR